MRYAFGTLLGILIACPSIARAAPPSILREPLLGLRFDRMRVGFEHLPPKVLAPCPTLADRESIKSNWYVFGQADGDEGKTYYLVGGYSIRTARLPVGIPKYERDDAGVIFSIKGDTCVVFEDAARAMFEPYMAGEIPEPVLLALARDHRRRLTRAFAGSDQLRAAMRRENIAIDKLPPALREAYSAILK